MYNLLLESMKLSGMNIAFYLLLISVAFGGFLFSFFIEEHLASYGLLIAVSFGGFLLASYLWYKRNTKSGVVCPIGANCTGVLNSEYSRFFGIPLEWGGMAYYGIIFCVYSAYVFAPHILNGTLLLGALGLSSIAFLFSLYLVFIQAFTLRMWCSWCLLSAVFSSVIFIVSLSSWKFGVGLLVEFHGVFLAVHQMSFAIGLGAATVVSIFFFKFLRDLRISQEEAGVLGTISQLIWFSLAILILSQFALYLPERGALNTSPHFLIEMIALLVVIITGALLNLVISPRLMLISFGGKHVHHKGELAQLRRLTFGIGAVSLASWYVAFILERIPQIPLGLISLFGLYIFIIAGAAGVSQAVAYRLAHLPSTAEDAHML